MNTKDDITESMLLVKDQYGAIYAKALIESFGVSRLAEIKPEHYAAAIKTAKAMCAERCDTNAGKHAALTILVKHIDDHQDWWRVNTDHRNIEVALADHALPLVADEPYAGQTVNVTVPLAAEPAVIARKLVEPDPALREHAAMSAKLNPNDIIACLLEIAFKAQRVVTTGISNSDSTQLRNYHDLADAFAPLQQLPGPFEWTPAQRAKTALQSFIQAASVTIAGKEALEGIMAAMDAAVPGFLEAGGVVGPATNDGWVIAKETVVEMPDGKKELGYTFISGLGVFTDEHDASKSLNELELPLGYVIMGVTQLLPGFIMPLLDEAVGLEKPVNEVFAVRNYDDAYVEQLSVAVADLATDGKRFRTMMWMVLQGMAQEMRSDAVLTGGDAEAMGEEELKAYLNYIKANDIMARAEPASLEQFRAALDEVYRAGVLPDMDAKAADSAHAHDVLRAESLKLAEKIVANYEDNHGRCIHCETVVEDLETIEERHAADCAVSLARQLIENES